MTVSASVTIDTPSASTSYTNAATAIVMNTTMDHINTLWVVFYRSDDAGTTWTVASNITNQTDNQTLFNATISVANFSTDGNWTLNATAWNGTDLGTDQTTSVSNVLNIDSVAPTSTVQFTDNDLTNLTANLKADYGSEVLVNCTPTDATAGINIYKSYISIKYPGVSSYSDNLSLTANTTSQVTATVLDSQTRGDLGEYSIKCFVEDNAGNTVSTILNFTTQTVVVGAGSAAGSTGTAAIEGWENPVGTIMIGSGTVSEGGRLTTEGISRLMKTNAVIKLDISGENHRIEVKAATDDKVVLTISSEPFDVTINAGETEEVDVNGDGIADLEVTYHKLFAKTSADLTFKQISVPVEAEAMDDESVDETTTEEDTEDYASSNGGLTVTLAVIVIILIIGYALIKGKKK
ncbi:hypothetical protein HOB91_01335 [Candidatus Woesearchaeota archaeon]|nr:hypothetical protein [Candidatus Woesearchaeota archaeon]